MIDNDFKRINAYHRVYIKIYQNDNFIVLLLYVYDMLIVGQGKNMINRLEKDLNI